jgi:hypothetical protein
VLLLAVLSVVVPLVLSDAPLPVVVLVLSVVVEPLPVVVVLVEVLVDALVPVVTPESEAPVPPPQATSTLDIRKIGRILPVFMENPCCY